MATTWCQLKGLLVVAVASLGVFLTACTTLEAPSAATPFPFTIQVLTPTPPSQAPDCPVALCCFHCPIQLIRLFKPVTKIADFAEGKFACSVEYDGVLSTTPKMEAI